MLLTPLFAALFGFFYVFLSVNVVKHRFSKKISLGSNGDKSTEVAVRAHANFIEYVPLCLILFYFLEMVTLSSSMVFFLGCVLFVARIMHVVGMFKPREFLVLRQIGVVATFAVILAASSALALRYIPISV